MSIDAALGGRLAENHVFDCALGRGNSGEERDAAQVSTLEDKDLEGVARMDYGDARASGARCLRSPAAST